MSEQASIYYQSLTGAGLDPIVTMASYGRITDVNTATETVTGYPMVKLI